MIIVVGNEKGGVGKSTLALNLATMLRNDKTTGKVLLVDADVQASLSRWNEVRNINDVKPEIPLVSTQGSQIHKTLKQLSEDYDTIIVDVAGKDTPELRSSVLAADLIVVPVSVSQFDIFSTKLLRVVIENALPFNEKLKTLVVNNKRSTNPSLDYEVDDVRGYIEDDNFKIAKTSIYERVAYRRSVPLGLGVTELKGPLRDVKAINEIKELYKEIKNEFT